MKQKPMGTPQKPLKYCVFRGLSPFLHTLAKRPHCFQNKAAPGTGSYTYLDRIWEFMNHKGYNK